MDSDFHQQHFQDFPRQFHHSKPQTNSLTRFRSAPSSYFASLFDETDETINSTGGATGNGNIGERRDFTNPRPLSPETENIFNSFMSSFGAENNNSSQKLSNIPEDTAVQPDFATRVKHETDFQQQQQPQLQQENYSKQSQMIHHSQSKPPLSNQHTSVVSSAIQSSFTRSSMGMAAMPQMNTGLGGGNNNNNNSSLTRYNSSPAGFFANLNIDIGYEKMGSGGTSNYGGNVQINYSSGQPSTSGLMKQNSDVREKITRMNSLDKGGFNNQKDEQNYVYPLTSWDDSTLLENFSSGDGSKTFTELTSPGNQNGEVKNCPSRLIHHLSLPTTIPEILATENFQQFQDTVPCRTRAKRGCATHPRSIAERVRRTRISERMRRLQDLVPNMDTQTNTSDMLDLAVDYIKTLQKQVETLTDNREQCTCSR